MRDNKPKSAKQTSKKRSRTPAQLKKDAARLFNIMNSAEVSSDIRYEIGVLLLERVDPANHYEQYPDLFTLCYTIAAKDSGNEHAQAELERILNHLDAGERLESVVEIAEKKMREQAIETQPDFAALARHISAVLKDPNTPDYIYSALADRVSDMSDGYLGAIHESAPFIEKCLIFEARGEASETTSEAKTDEQQRAELARLIRAVITHPKLPEDLRDSIAQGLTDVQNKVGAREITESLQGIRATLEIYERRDGDDDTTDLQPRNKREQAIVDDVLEHAEEIRAARASCDSRASAIGKGGQG